LEVNFTNAEQQLYLLIDLVA